MVRFDGVGGVFAFAGAVGTRHAGEDVGGRPGVHERERACVAQVYWELQPFRMIGLPAQAQGLTVEHSILGSSTHSSTQ